MQKIYFGVLSIIFLSLPACNNQQVEVDLWLKGNIKKIMQTTYQAIEVDDYESDEVKIGDVLYTSNFYFTPEGRLIRIKGTDVNLSLDYTDDKNVVAAWSGKMNEQEKISILYFIKYEYFMQRDECVERWQVTDSLVSPVANTYRIMEWDAEFSILRISTLDEEKNIFSLEQIRYDEKGILLNDTFQAEDMLARRSHGLYAINEEGDYDDENVFYGKENYLTEWTDIYKYENFSPGNYLESETYCDTYNYINCDKKGNWTERKIRTEFREITLMKRIYSYY